MGWAWGVERCRPDRQETSDSHVSAKATRNVNGVPKKKNRSVIVSKPLAKGRRRTPASVLKGKRSKGARWPEPE